MRTVTVELGQNELLVRIPVAVGTESDWEAGYSAEYATAGPVDIVAETLDDHTAALVGYEIESGDLFPDGVRGLTEALGPVVEDRRAADEAARAARDEIHLIGESQ